MSRDGQRRTFADVYRDHPEGFADLAEIAEREGLDVLADPMREAMRDVDGPNQTGR